MLWLLAAVGTAFCFGINNTIFKWGTTKNVSKVMTQLFFYLIAFVIMLMFAIARHELNFSIPAIIFGLFIGIFNANGNIQMTKAFEKGPASITSTLIASNSIVVVLATALFFPESIPGLHWLGIGLMLAAAVVIQYQSNTRMTIEYKPWLLSCIFAFLSIGLVGVIMKIATYQQVDFTNLLVSMYGGGFLYLCILARKEWKSTKNFQMEFKLGSIVGVLSVIGYSCYLFALKTGFSSVVFPIISLNCVIVMLMGLIVFKERLKMYQFLGIIIALFGLVLSKI